MLLKMYGINRFQKWEILLDKISGNSYLKQSW